MGRDVLGLTLGQEAWNVRAVADADVVEALLVQVTASKSNVDGLARLPISPAEGLVTPIPSTKKSKRNTSDQRFVARLAPILRSVETVAEVRGIGVTRLLQVVLRRFLY